MAVILLIGGLTAIFMFFAWIASSVADNGVKASTKKVIRALGESAAKQSNTSGFKNHFLSKSPYDSSSLSSSDTVYIGNVNHGND